MIEQLWATPLFRAVVADPEAFNQAFSAHVRQRITSGAAGVERSNVGGWHSSDDLLDWPLPELAQLRQWIAHAIQSLMQSCAHDQSGLKQADFQLNAWANVSSQGDYHLPHAHPNSSWSGVYYVATGDDDLKPASRGRIGFLDPRTGAGNFTWPGTPFDRRVEIDPEPGLLVAFPSWLMHYVLPFQGNSERISIAFNLVITGTRSVADVGPSVHQS